MDHFDKKKLYIFGDDYPTKDGTCVRDYIHVADLADAHLGALSHLLDNGSTDFINLGTGIGFSVKEVVSHVEKVTKKKINIQISQKRPGDPPVLITKKGRAKEIFGWVPNFEDIEIQIYHAWEWYKKTMIKY